MAKCTNCKAVITCGCQRKTANDGKQCCDKCVTQYNKSLQTNNG